MSNTSDKATEVSFDLSKQFISLAFAGVAFAIGLSSAEGAIAAGVVFWVTIALFGVSALLGFLFMMGGAASLAKDGAFDIFELGPRIMAIFQIVFVFVGVILLLLLHVRSIESGKAPSEVRGLRIEHNGTVIDYPASEKLDVKVNSDGSFEVENR